MSESPRFIVSQDLFEAPGIPIRCRGAGLGDRIDFRQTQGRIRVEFAKARFQRGAYGFRDGSARAPGQVTGEAFHIGIPYA
jgi:hypothetical protein